MKIKFHVYAAIILGLTLIAGNIEASSKIEHPRFSIAISGGASKGAYEAGINWGLLKIGRDVSSLKTLSGGRVSPPELGSITGASAGGINTLLSGLTWCSRSEKEGGIQNRIDDNVFRDIWLRIDINTLLPRRADSPRYLPDDAVLSRRDFLDASAELRDKWNKPAFRKGCRIPLGVTVTRIDPELLTVANVDVQNQRFYIPFELRVISEGNIGFFFDPSDYPKVVDPAMILMPRQRDTPPFSIADKRVEDAAFTTSAFPMAFGRKRLQYCRLVAQKVTNEPGQQKHEMGSIDSDLVCPDGYELAEAEFADGGLFDNLPIGLARMLAEENTRALNNPAPVTYFYLDPNRKRYRIPDPDKGLVCGSPNPPEACRVMEYSFASENKLLIGFLGTSRRYELYRELTSVHWQLNLSEISYQLAEKLKQGNIMIDCHKDLPYFDRQLDCTDALYRAGQLLDIAYERARPIIDEPYSVSLLQKAGIIERCKKLANETDSKIRAECDFDITRYRKHLADAMISIAEQAKLTKNKIYNHIKNSSRSKQHDRALRVSSRGAPITGTLLEDFGSFLEYKFREYDYYVGVYDAVVMLTDNQCSLQYSSVHQSEAYRQCFETVSEQLYSLLGLSNDARGQYVFARLAKREYGKDKLLRFAYEPLPTADRDMYIIHEGLEKALAAGETEKVFFEHLKAEGFVPTPDRDGKQPLLSQIIDEPDSWATELTRRMTARLVYLETQAEKIYVAREPDPQKRQTANTGLMGATAFALQSATYRYPEFSFAPSTAPDNWVWRNIIPFEIGFDNADGDLLFTWQPTLALSKKDLLGLRASLGFAGGLFKSSADDKRENYLGIGIDYTRRTPASVMSSFGLTSSWYQAFKKQPNGDQGTLGGEAHVSFLKDRLRVGVGTRDFGNISDAWLLTVGIADLPGMVYWLTR